MLNLMIPRNGLGTARLPLDRSLSRQLFGWDGVESAPRYAPRADVLETKESVVVRFEMPGLDAGDISVDLEKDVLTIKAERKAPEAAEGQLYHRSELAYGTFTRAFTLPVDVERDGIEAAYVQGILTVTLPKAASTKPRSIEVKTS